MRVELERFVRGIDGDRDGPDRGYGLLQLILVSFGQIDQPDV